MSRHVNCFPKQCLCVPACTTLQFSANYRAIMFSSLPGVSITFANLCSSFMLLSLAGCGPGALQGVSTNTSASPVVPLIGLNRPECVCRLCRDTHRCTSQRCTVISIFWTCSWEPTVKTPQLSAAGAVGPYRILNLLLYRS